MVKVYHTLTAILALLFAAAAAAATTSTAHAAPPSATQIYGAVSDVHKCLTVVNIAAAKYKSTRSKLLGAKLLLNTACGSIDSLEQDAKLVTRFFKTISKVPISKIPKVADSFANGMKRVSRTIEKPADPVCAKLSPKVRSTLNKFDKFDQSPTGKSLAKYASRWNKVDSKLTLIENSIETYNAIKNRRVTICPSIVQTYRDVVEMKESCENVLSHYEQAIAALDKIEAMLDNTITPRVNTLASALRKMQKGPLGKVIELIAKLQKVSVRLPSGRTKDRGAGLVPKCCPSGYKLTAGLCYKNCPSGYATVGLVCMERCRSGYRTVGPTCVKKKFGLKKLVYGRKTRTRFGSAPATHSRSACACRTDGRTHLGGGLCYRKCGVGSMKGYNTPFLTTCMDTTLKRYTVEQLASKLDIFKHIKKVPGIGDILKIADKAVDKFLEPINKLTGNLFAIKLPSISLPSFNVNAPTIPKTVMSTADRALSFANKLKYLKFEADGFCLKIQA